MQPTTIRLLLQPADSSGHKIIEIHGPADITNETTEAIVNAANSSLLGGGGVDGAIHEAGGSTILEACREIVKKIGTLSAGKAVITSGGLLAAKHVIHTVGPVYRGGERGEPETLASCYRESAKLADQRGLGSIAFPAISTGAYGYPLAEAASIALATITETLASTRRLRQVRFVLFDGSAVKTYWRLAKKLYESSTPPRFTFETINSSEQL